MQQATPIFLSSGDFLADRRYEWAMDFAARGDLSAAAELLDQAIERKAEFAAAWFALGEVRLRALDAAGAVAAFRAAVAADPEDRLGAGLHLARLGNENAAAAMSPAYVRTLFDQYAPRFDQALVEHLCYRGPALAREALEKLLKREGRAVRFGRVIDLGCGTGLVGAAFSASSASMIGIDVSAAMIDQARRKHVYDDLVVGDMVTALERQDGGTIDLVIAIDAFPYLADLAPVCGAAARVLKDGALLVFTVETHPGEGVVLGEKLRYAHGGDHISVALAAAGLGCVVLDPASTRCESNAAVIGLIVAARKGARAMAR
jgi:predicted TPR repeat methyltransferase